MRPGFTSYGARGAVVRRGVRVGVWAALLLLCAGAHADIVITADLLNFNKDLRKFTGMADNPFRQHFSAAEFNEGVPANHAKVTRSKLHSGMFTKDAALLAYGEADGTFSINDAEAIITDLHFKIPEGSTAKFKATGNVGGKAFPMVTVADNGKSITFDGGNIPKRDPESRDIPYVWFRFDDLGDTKPEVRITPEKPKQPDKKGKEGGASAGAASGVPCSYTPDTGVFQFGASQVGLIQYLDGSSGIGSDPLTGQPLLIGASTMVGPSPDLAGAWRLTDSFISFGSLGLPSLYATLTDVLLIPDSSVPGFDSVIQASLVWAQERPAFGSRVLDEFYGPDSPVAQPTLFLRTNLLAATSGLTGPGSRTAAPW